MSSSFEIDFDNAYGAALSICPDKAVAQAVKESLNYRKMLKRKQSEFEDTGRGVDLQQEIWAQKQAGRELIQKIMQNRPDIARWVHGMLASVRSGIIKDLGPMGLQAHSVQNDAKGNSLAGATWLRVFGHVSDPNCLEKLLDKRLQDQGISRELRVCVVPASRTPTRGVHVLSRM